MLSSSRSPFTTLSWIHAGTASQKPYMRAAPPLPLNTLQSPCSSPGTLYVHSSPSSPSANCTPSVDAAATRTQSTSCSIFSDEGASATKETHCCHLPYYHSRLAFTLSDETCSVVLNPYTHTFPQDRRLKTPSLRNSLLGLDPALGFILPSSWIHCY